jgi:hypothetical protein
VESVGAEENQENKDGAASKNPDQPRSQDEMDRIDGGYELVLNALAPDIIQQDVGDVDLTDLNNAHGDDPDQDEGSHIGAQLQILG